ncbi:hypothetical protein SERLA73DRAFT_54721, partial [Serpula lacrymans var. lacrymans S7.3]
DAIIADVKAALAAKYPKFCLTRQKIALKDDTKLLPDRTTSKGISLVGGEELTEGPAPQISWRTVFLVECVRHHSYLHLCFQLNHFSDLFYGSQIRHIVDFDTLHFIKHELETFSVHRFSHGTMPFTSIFKN